MLKKRLNAIAYHCACEAQAAGFIRVAWEHEDTNIADLLTKLMPGPRLNVLVGYVRYGRPRQSPPYKNIQEYTDKRWRPLFWFDLRASFGGVLIELLTLAVDLWCDRADDILPPAVVDRGDSKDPTTRD